MGLERFAVHRTNVFSLQPTSHGPLRVMISCPCGKIEQVPGCDPNTPPQTAAKHARRNGWEVDNDGREARCRTCLGVTLGSPPRNAERVCGRDGCGQTFVPGRRGKISEFCSPRCRDLHRADVHAAEQRPAEVAPVVSEQSAQAIADALERAGIAVPPPTTETTMPIHVVPPPVDEIHFVPTARHARQVFQLLELHFVEGRWHSGWSDDVVARETGTPRSYVSETREEAYGPVRDEVAEAIDRVRVQMSVERAEVIALVNSTFDAMHARIDELERKMQGAAVGAAEVR